MSAISSCYKRIGKVQEAVDHNHKEVISELEELSKNVNRKSRVIIKEFNRVLKNIDKTNGVHATQKHARVAQLANKVPLDNKHKHLIARSLQKAYQQFWLNAHTHLYHDHQLFLFLRTLTPNMLNETTRKAVRNNDFKEFVLITHPDALAELDYIVQQAQKRIDEAEKSADAASAPELSQQLAPQPMQFDANFTETIMY